MFDVDGKYIYSSIRVVNFNSISSIIITPNPVKNILQLTNSFGEAFTGRFASETINIYSSSTQLVQTIKVIQADRYTATIPVERLASGIYFLKLISGGRVSTLKFVKE